MQRERGSEGGRERGREGERGRERERERGREGGRDRERERIGWRNEGGRYPPALCLVFVLCVCKQDIP